jgi:hypothetical protein
LLRLLGSIFDPEDVGSTILRNIGRGTTGLHGITSQKIALFSVLLFTRSGTFGFYKIRSFLEYFSIVGEQMLRHYVSCVVTAKMAPRQLVPAVEFPTNFCSSAPIRNTIRRQSSKLSDIIVFSL